MVNFNTDETLDIWRAARATRPWASDFTLLQQYPEYPVINRFLANGVERRPGGTEIEWEVGIPGSGNAGYTQEDRPITSNVQDVIVKLKLPWRLAVGTYAAYRGEIIRNGGESAGAQAVRLHKLLDIRRADAQIQLADILEQRAWRCPDSSTDVDNPYGFPYWIPPITGAQVTTRAAAVAAGTADCTGFFGGMNPVYGDGTTAALKAGVSLALAKYERLRTWVDVWTNSTGELTEADINKLSWAFGSMNWQGPLTAKQFMDNTKPKFQIFTSLKMIVKSEEKARANNDNLGSDLGKFMGSVISRGVPWTRAPLLENSTANTLMFVNMNEFKVFGLKGDIFQEIGPDYAVDLPRKLITSVWLSHQYAMRLGRTSGRIDYVAAA